jgi:hypothetical protein
VRADSGRKNTAYCRARIAACEVLLAPVVFLLQVVGNVKANTVDIYSAAVESVGKRFKK